MADKKAVDPAALASVPVIVNLGKKTKKEIKKLKKGSGKLLEEVADAMDEVRARLPEADKGKQIVPVVMFVERKAKKLMGGKFPFSPLSMLK
jgi:hypothetical protein